MYTYIYIYIYYHVYIYISSYMYIYIYIQIVAIMAIMDVNIIISFIWATQWMVFATHHDFGDDLVRELPSGKHTKNYGKSPFLMGKSTISMAIFNSYVSLPEGIPKES